MKLREKEKRKVEITFICIKRAMQIEDKKEGKDVRCFIRSEDNKKQARIPLFAWKSSTRRKALEQFGGVSDQVQSLAGLVLFPLILILLCPFSLLLFLPFLSFCIYIFFLPPSYCVQTTKMLETFLSMLLFAKQWI